ncbi:carboxymuconolactone decarboxylase family protein [Mycolicibacterium peregrinum]|uniref:Uncharacterized protein n=1 Tax=Mycolicibacterium peregrinum TaxID=43304 RepID=A0A1A0VMA7_MYCPR|nr:carboxymuconolactone decarboxylase family protein [Mycolicibacterium peregrinum]OBB84387.1 hypothetical protein A5779_06545 [Mycolicibacterium peregrinum]
MDYPNLDNLPQHLKDILASHAPVNIYKMIMHSPGLAPGFMVIADAMFQANSLPPHLRELVILRVGYRYDAPYETHQHRMIARYAELSDQAAAAAASGDLTGLPDDEADMLRWTDTLLDEHTLTGADRDQALQRLGPTGLADLVLTVGFYQLVCNFLNTFDVTTDGEPTFD